jgi:hypothetical protein
MFAGNESELDTIKVLHSAMFRANTLAYLYRVSSTRNNFDNLGTSGIYGPVCDDGFDLVDVSHNFIQL